MRAEYSILWLIALLLISSCQKDFNIDPQKTGNELVINSLFNDYYPMTVYVTRSFPIGATNNYMTAIPDARVELYEDNIFKEVMHYVPSDTQAAFGAYLSDLIPKQGKSYTVKTFDASYLNATTTDQIPMSAQLITYDLQQYQDTALHPTANMYMVFKDDPAVQNYYRINVWISGMRMYISSQGDTSYAFENYAIEPFPQSPLNDTVRDGNFLLFSDRGFNGQEKNLQLSFNTINRTGFKTLNVYVELHTVSKAHYQYFKTLNFYRTTGWSAEPVFIYSNVNNGLGDFVAEHWQTMTFAVR